MMPSGHKAFLVQNPRDVDLLLMHNKTYAAEYDLANLCVSDTNGRLTAKSGSAMPSHRGSELTLLRGQGSLA